jgi:hypothetical protein
MARIVHQEFNPDAIEHFTIDCDPYGVIVDRSGLIETVFVDESKYTTKKLISILDKSDCDVQPDMTLYKKAFVLPNCPISNDRIKAALKEHKITITRDLSKADLLLSHSVLETSASNGENINHNYLFNHLWNFDAIEKGCSEVDEYCEENKRGHALARVIYDTKVEEGFVSNYNAEFEEMPYDSYIMTGLAINAAYEVEVNGLAVFDVDKVMHQSATKVKLDEQLMSDILAMVNESGSDNWNMVGAILPTIDYRFNHHLLWKLSCEIGSSIYQLNRNKDVQYWKSISGIDDFFHKSALDMIQWMEEEDVLTTTSFKYLESIVRKEIRIENRDLYVFKVSVKPEYKKFLK